MFPPLPGMLPPDHTSNALEAPAPAARPKVVALSDHARTNAQIDVLTLLKEVITDCEARQAAGQPLPTLAFIVTGVEGMDSDHLTYWRSKLPPEKEVYVLNQALLACLMGQRGDR